MSPRIYFSALAQRRIEELETQNRDLLAALENLAEAVEDVNNLTGLDHAYNAARAAIAAAKETK